MAQILTVTFSDGTTDHYPLKPADIVRLERHFGLKLGAGFKIEDMTADQVFFLIYSAAKRMKRTELAYDDWLDTVEETGDASVPLDPSSNGAAEQPLSPESLSVS